MNHPSLLHVVVDRLNCTLQALDPSILISLAEFVIELHGIIVPLHVVLKEVKFTAVVIAIPDNVLDRHFRLSILLEELSNTPNDFQRVGFIIAHIAFDIVHRDAIRKIGIHCVLLFVCVCLFI
nr:MAG TPA: hypothetical protein [Caudoviricetes sp.]